MDAGPFDTERGKHELEAEAEERSAHRVAVQCADCGRELLEGDVATRDPVVLCESCEQQRRFDVASAELPEGLFFERAPGPRGYGGTVRDAQERPWVILVAPAAWDPEEWADAVELRVLTALGIDAPRRETPDEPV